MSAPPDPEMRRGRLAKGSPGEIAKKQPQRYQPPLVFQAAAIVLLPIIVSVVLLAIAGGQR
jgi:hypothetical protein